MIVALHQATFSPIVNYTGTLGCVAEKDGEMDNVAAAGLLNRIQETNITIFHRNPDPPTTSDTIRGEGGGGLPFIGTKYLVEFLR